MASPNDPNQKKALGKQVEEARSRYETRVEIKKKNPAGKGLDGWYDAHLSWQMAHRELISPLVAYWMLVEPGDAEFRKLEDEVRRMLKEFQGSDGLRSYFLSQAWKALADPNVSANHARALTKLAKPNASVRISDGIRSFGLTPEPLGWDQQLTYALGLIRCGKLATAESEIRKLNAKIPEGNGRLDYGPEAGDARYRNYLDYRQTCCLLKGLVAKARKADEEAQRWLLEATMLREDSFSPEGKLIVAELRGS